MSDMVFPLYHVTFGYDAGDGTEVETTSPMRPWLYPTEPGPMAVVVRALTVWPTLKWRREPERDRRLVYVEIIRKPDVPWALGWFTHQTFRVGRSDDELRSSFERWVRRWEQYQEDLRHAPTDTPCLMGAEDRWRWQPFCPCETCKRNDVAMIAH